MNTASVSVVISSTAQFFCSDMPQIVREGASQEEAVLLFNAIGEWRQAQRKLEQAHLKLESVTGAQEIRTALWQHWVVPASQNLAAAIGAVDFWKIETLSYEESDPLWNFLVECFREEANKNN
jgi:hypothetical protein